MDTRLQASPKLRARESRPCRSRRPSHSDSCSRHENEKPGWGITQQRQGIVRAYKNRRWIICVLEFRDRHRGDVTENAKAPGHRPNLRDQGLETTGAGPTGVRNLIGSKRSASAYISEGLRSK
jgi:hypothetical protein